MSQANTSQVVCNAENSEEPKKFVLVDGFDSDSYFLMEVNVSFFFGKNAFFSYIV